MTYDLAVCNTMAASKRPTGKAVSIVRRTLEAYPGAVIVGVVEASNLSGTRPQDWTPRGDRRVLRKVQRGPVARAGVAAVVDVGRVQVTSIRYRASARPFLRGRRIGMRTRHILILRARVDGGPVRRYKVVHLPPKRFWALWPGAVASIGRSGAVLADFNKLARAVAPALRRRVFMDRLIGIAVPYSWRASNPRHRDVGADHSAVAVTIHQRSPR